MMLKTFRYSDATTFRWRLFCLGPMLTGLLLIGCTLSDYGRLQSSPEVSQVFESGQLISGYRYYVSGFQRVPYAIIAIDNRYELRRNHWQPIDLDATELNQLVYRMEHVYSLSPRGAWILDPEGNRLGIWYSSQYYTKVRREDSRIVVVPPEPPDLRGIP
jgi:hypothetical protein